LSQSTSIDLHGTLLRVFVPTRLHHSLALEVRAVGEQGLVEEELVKKTGYRALVWLEVFGLLAQQVLRKYPEVLQVRTTLLLV
jgi:hypothetical protein